MRRILVLIDGTYPSNYIFSAAVNLAKETPSFLNAAFINNRSSGIEYGYFFPNDLSLTQNNLTGKSIAEENNEMRESNIKLFKDECEAAGVKYIIDKKDDFPLHKLIQYSGFFDLILADAKSNLYEYLLSDLLADAHCPVLLTTADMQSANHLILTYDGTASSVYAIRMFTYLFPEWKNKPVDLVHIAPQEIIEVPHDADIKSWMSFHYDNAKMHILEGSPQKSLIDFTRSKSGNSLIVMGAFGKNALARMFHKSLSAAVIKELNAAIFITHN